MESKVNRWIEPTASWSQMNEGPYSWTPGLWAEIYPLFFWPPIVQIVPCAGLSTHAVFSDKAKPGGARPVRCVWRLDYAELHTEGGIWRRFSWQITAGPLQVLCLPSSSRASLTELLPCWLATLETPPGLTELSVRDGRKIRREMGEEKQRIGEERERDKWGLWEEHTAVGWSLLVKCTLYNTKNSLSFFVFVFRPAVQRPVFPVQWTMLLPGVDFHLSDFFFFSIIA